MNPDLGHARVSLIGRFATHHAKGVLFIAFGLCLAGVYAATTISSSVFPQTNFPRVVILIDNGIMPADEMVATVTRPIEEAMKDIPGAVKVTSTTGRGSAEVSVFFTWNVDMVQSELFVLSRVNQVRSSLPATASTSVYRLTFSAFPICGVSLTSKTRDITSLWETARYTLKPRFLRIPGVARVDLVGGRTPEYHVVVDPTRMAALNLSLPQITDALTKSNLVASAGLTEENHTLYLTEVDGRVHTADDIANLTIAAPEGRPIRIKDVATVQRGPEPVFNKVTADDGLNAVLINIRSQPDGSTVQIADDLKADMKKLAKDLPPDMKLAFYYDQSELVRESVRSVWEAILFGLILSVIIMYAFLKNWGTVLVATVVIPVTVLITLVAMRLMGLTFNLMTLGGIASAIGLVIDDAIVVVEAIYTKMSDGRPRMLAVQEAIGEIFMPLVGSTLTPVVVFIPLAYLAGLDGVFFRALALTMVVSLLMSLVLAITLTPALAPWLIRVKPGAGGSGAHTEEGGFLLRRVIRVYEFAVRTSLRHRWITVGILALFVMCGIAIYGRLKVDFLPEMDEGGFVIDYFTAPGTSLAETNRQLLQVEEILKKVPEVESYSRRTGARLALSIAEPNTGDFLVKLKTNRKRSTDDVIKELREKFNRAVPDANWDLHDILGDLIGDLIWAPKQIEIKIFSTDVDLLKTKAPQIKELLAHTKGVVDVPDDAGVTITGPSISLKIRSEDAARYGMDADDIARQVNTALLGQTASTVLNGDRIMSIRVQVAPSRVDRLATLRTLPIRAPAGTVVPLSQVADVVEKPGQLEIQREDLRQNIAVTGRLEGRDLGSAMEEIKAKVAKDTSLPPGTIEYGGLYQQEQESTRNLTLVLAMAVLLVFTVLLLEFRSFIEPVSIVAGAVLALLGTVTALWITGTSLNIVSRLGAIIGVGIVAKNGILMLDFVKQLRAQGQSVEEALVHSGRRRLRPVLMTSMAAALGMLPLAYGIGSGAETLKPLAIAVIGALCFSVLLSLVATPTIYFLLSKLTLRRQSP